MAEWSDIWWSQITGPRSLADSVTQALRDRNTVCLCIPDDLPWRSAMRVSIDYELRQTPEMEDFFVEVIDAADEFPQAADVGRFLLERFASPEIVAGYRSREGIHKYLFDHQALKNRVLWIKGMDPGQETLWMRFCLDYACFSKGEARFVLELRWSDGPDDAENVSVIKYNDLITSHDLTLFNSIYLNRETPELPPIWQHYAAVLCALLCSTDAEISQALMEDCDFMTQEPLVQLERIAAEAYFLRRGESNRDHILHMVRSQNTKLINKQIWKAQLQTAFPLIELERIALVQAYRDRIGEALQTEYLDVKTEDARRIYQFGELLEDPDRAELGTIYRMMRLRRYADPYRYLLYFPDEDVRERITLLHELRNLLAHGNVCPIEKLAAFIERHPYAW